MLGLILAALLAAAPADCSYDKAAMLSLSPDKFDQDLEGGWRPLGEKKGCFLAAADLLSDYREAHRSTFSEYELEINNWHEGQMRAMAGQSREAVRLLMAGVGPDSGGDFEDYALGTVAFLQRDLPALASARARLASQSKPASWSQTVAEFKAKGWGEPKWPPNLDVLDRLIACFDKPYAQAYGGDCRPPKPKS